MVILCSQSPPLLQADYEHVSAQITDAQTNAVAATSILILHWSSLLASLPVQQPCLVCNAATVAAAAVKQQRTFPTDAIC